MKLEVVDLFEAGMKTSEQYCEELAIARRWNGHRLTLILFFSSSGRLELASEAS